MMVRRVPLSWFKLHLLLLRVLTIARTFWPLRMLLLLPSALYLVLCQAIVVANAQLLDPLDEIELPPPPPPPPEALAEAWPDAEGPLTAETPATAVLVMTALRLVPVVTGLNSFLVLLILAIFVAALIFLLVFHVTLNWRPFQKGGRTGSVKADSALTTTGESSDCQLTPATPTASSHLPSDRTSKSHTHPHPSVPVDATTSSRLPCVCFPPFCCCYSPCDFCCLPPLRQPVTTTTSAGMTACSHFSPTPSRDTKEADSVTTLFHQEHTTTTTTNGSDTQITASAPATPPGGGGGCDNRFAGGEISSLPTSPSPQPVAAGALSQRRMISVPSLSQLPQVGQPEHVQPLCFDGRQLAAALPTGDISGRSLTSAVGATSGVLHLRSAAVCVIPQQREAASAPRTPLCAQPAVVGLHRLSTISASLSDVASASATAPTAELSTDSKAVLGRSADEVDAAGRWHPKATPSSLQSSANSVAADSASHDAFKRTTITAATGTSRTPKRSLLESRRGSHTSLTLVLSPIIDSPHAAPQPSMSNPHGSQGSASFMGARGHRTNRFSPMAATTSPVSLHRPYGDEDSAALFSPEDRSHLQPRLRQPQQQQQRDYPGSSSSSHQGASEGFNSAAGTTADHEILCQSSLPLTGQQLEKKLREDVASLFSEFWSIPTNLTSRNKCGLAGVGQKNRYAGIIPNNETRVILPQTNNDELTTYINANYIHGYAGVPRAFIATQGPMTHTVNDFWRMIWHTRAPAIVMLTRLVESGKVKCEFYLPDSKFEAPTERSGPGRADTVPGGTAAGSRSGGTSSADPPTATAALFLKSANSFPSQRGGGARKFVGRTGATDEEETDLSRTCARAGSQQMFGSVLVRVDSVVLKAGYTKRFITLKQGDEEHKVTHFWYVAWPDHSSPEATPTAARHLLHLVHETEACRYARAGASSGHCIPQSLSSPSTPSVAMGSPPPTLPVPPPSRRFQRQHAEERTDAEVVDLLSEEEETTDFYGRGYRASDPLAVATGPVVVHCSAGIGRTGCFIALCIGCEQLRREDKVDVFGIVNRLRLDRGGMVEDHSQYAFLHIALATFNSLQRGLAPPEFPVMDLSLGFPRPGR